MILATGQLGPVVYGVFARTLSEDVAQYGSPGGPSVLGSFVYNLRVTAVPGPPAVLLLASGLVALGLRVTRTRHQA